MSRKMNRKQMSPIKIRSNSEYRRNNLDADVQRIINHAAKLISKYNTNCLEQVMDKNIDNNEKIEQLLRQSTISLPKISIRKKVTKLKGSKKRKKSSSYDHFSENTKQNSLENTGGREESLQESHSYNTKDQILSKNSQRKSSTENFENSQRSLSRISITKCSRRSSGSKSKSNVIFQEKPEETNDLREREINFIYELEIKAAESIKGECGLNVTLQLTGESYSMPEPVLLNNLFDNQSGLRPFQSGNLDCFTLVLNDYLGTISNVKIHFNSENENSSWFLDYICIKDISSGQEYFFSCRRWLGSNSPDKLCQITLGYTPPFKFEQHALSKCTTENLTDKEADISVKSNKTIKSLESSIEMNDNRSQSSSSLPDSELKKSDRRETPDEILEKPVEPDCPAANEVSIHSAIITNNVVRVKELCNRFAELKDAPDSAGCHPIHLAGRYYKNSDESREIIHYLIGLGVDINQRSSEGLVSLHYAVLNNNCSAVEFLVEHCEADPHIVDRDGDTCLIMALKYGFLQIVDYLERFNSRKSLLSKKVDIIGETDDQKNVEYLFHEETSVSSVNNTKEDSIKDISKKENIIGETYDEENVDYLFHGETSISPEVTIKEELMDNVSKSDSIVIDHLFHEKVSVSSEKSMEEETIKELSVHSENLEILANEIPQDNKLETYGSEHDGSTESLQEQSPIMVDNAYHETEVETANEVLLSKPEPTNLENRILSMESPERDEVTNSAKSESKRFEKPEREASFSGSDHSKSSQHSSRIMNVDKEEPSNFQLLEEDQLDAENRGIMFHKTLTLSVSQKVPSERDQLSQNKPDDLQGQTNQPTQSNMMEENDTSSYSSLSKSTSLAGSEDTMSTITPRSNSVSSLSDNSIRNTSKKTNKKEDTETLSSGKHSSNLDGEENVKGNDIQIENRDNTNDNRDEANEDLGEKVVTDDNVFETESHKIIHKTEQAGI